ncbi:acyl-CoA dehydrogenase family protein [Thalassomonas viridans]|uniref:Acyl-CoA dehydrogenase family protein n=1 Tax=Thalassomonas viridans TaxID=137584 RepID=A0AAF0CCN4_9GAMM|nr:acyl-CoA dehydrogenase family protein [Thalassomonas viridans]WDE08025.1 acyl-CoA dehydrogenase family protein [Thalassomonas viridans]
MSNQLKTRAITADPAKQIAALESLSQEVFSQRAHDYDLEARFPAENFTDLFHINALAAPVDPHFGGLGFAPEYGNIGALWRMTRAIAKADLSFARCWEGHNNALMLIDKLANGEQKQRWFSEITAKGHRWAAWSGEPQTKLPHQQYSIGTRVEQRDSGYVLNGNKVFATSCAGANRAILLVSLAGPGGAREVRDGENNLLMLACDLSDPSISFDGQWWDPIGMRSTVSYKVNFDNTFIPAKDCIGEVGDFLTRDMQSRFTPHYGVSFLGALDAAYEYTLKIINSQHRQQDPYVQQHIARVRLNIDTLHLWMQQVAASLDKQQFDVAREQGAQFRYLAEQLAQEGVALCIKICGARCLNKPSALERIYRDLTIYVQHDNADHILATIGRRALGLQVDNAFFKLKA